MPSTCRRIPAGLSEPAGPGSRHGTAEPGLPRGLVLGMAALVVVVAGIRALADLLAPVPRADPDRRGQPSVDGCPVTAATASSLAGSPTSGTVKFRARMCVSRSGSGATSCSRR